MNQVVLGEIRVIRSLGEIRVMRSMGEIRGEENRFFNHLMKITITRESKMTLMHSTSMKKRKKK